MEAEKNKSTRSLKNAKSKGMPVQSNRGQRAAGAVSSPALPAAAIKKSCPTSNLDADFAPISPPSATWPSLLSMLHLSHPNTPRPMSFEMRLHRVHLMQLVVQYAYLYGSNWADYDVLVLALTAVSVSRHLLLRSLYDTFSARRQLRRHAASYPYSSVLLFIIFIATPLVITARLFSLRRYTSVVLCLLPAFYSMLLFPRLLAPIPPDLLYLSHGTKAANSSGSNGKPARLRLTAYLLRYLAFRLGEAIFLAFLPLLAKAEPHLFYSRSTCLGFAFFLTGHTAILLLAQALVSLRQHIQTEGEPWRHWALVQPLPGVPPQTPGPLTRWRSGEWYRAGTTVTHKGKVYVALRDSPGPSPSNGDSPSQARRPPEPPLEALHLGPAESALLEAFADDTLLLKLEQGQVIGVTCLVLLTALSYEWLLYALMAFSSFRTLWLLDRAQKEGWASTVSTTEKESPTKATK